MNGKGFPPDFPPGLDWFNVKTPLSLSKLRGKAVLLDFWTYCCINCMHVLPDLKRLEEKYREELVVVGVHCAKFSNERNAENIRQAIMRYEIEHPVCNDHTFTMWRSYGVRAWPTMTLIHPDGSLVGTISGEGNWDFLNEAIGAIAKEARQQKILMPGVLHGLHLEKAKEERTLSYPGKIIANPDGSRFFISDSNHNRIVITDRQGKIQEVIGSGAAGLQEGSFADASFNHPQGLCLVGETLYIADTENHCLRRADMANKMVSTIAGTGKQAAPLATAGEPLRTHLNSPWDLVFHKGAMAIAMAGSHQIWKMSLLENLIGPFAGTGQENLVDGSLQTACFAQPSGLSLNGHNVYVADSETSSIRKIDLEQGLVTTLVGIALFDFGDVDGRGDEVRLQHPVGIHCHDEKIIIADTYNHKIKILDPKTRSATTLTGTGRAGHATGTTPSFYEPCGLWVVPPYLYIADTNNHRIVRTHLEDQVASEMRVF